jgi:hypothetical protein
MVLDLVIAPHVVVLHDEHLPRAVGGPWWAQARIVPLVSRAGWFSGRAQVGRRSARGCRDHAADLDAAKTVGHHLDDGRMVTVAAVRAVARTLPRTEEHVIRDRVKFRVDQLVYLAFSRDEKVMGFAFPKEERVALVSARSETFFLPGLADMRYNWVEAWLDRLDDQEMRQLVHEAWRMVVPKSVAAAHLGW